MHFVIEVVQIHNNVDWSYIGVGRPNCTYWCNYCKIFKSPKPCLTLPSHIGRASSRSRECWMFDTLSSSTNSMYSCFLNNRIIVHVEVCNCLLWSICNCRNWGHWQIWTLLPYCSNHHNTKTWLDSHVGFFRTLWGKRGICQHKRNIVCGDEWKGVGITMKAFANA